MPNFNLIPPKEKELIENTKRVYIISGIFKYLVIILVAFCLLLLSTNFSLSKLINSQKESLDKLKNDPIMKQILSLDENIKNANTNINNVYKVQNGFQYFSQLIEKIATLIPVGIYITDLKIEQKTTNQQTAIAPTTPDKEVNSQTTPVQESENQEQQSISFWEIILSGHAQTRDDLISLEENLNSVPEFSNVDSPRQNVIKPRDIDFTITFRIKK